MVSSLYSSPLGAPMITCITVVLLLASNQHVVNGCFESIISFGDSLADTGNLLLLSKSSHEIPHYALPPYGETYFHHPTGRISNGRLIIDFIAESLGLPLLPPYLGGKGNNSSSGRNFQGVNFAVAGATALDASFFIEKGLTNPDTNVSLGTQLDWFKKLLPSLCDNDSNCKKLLSRSLVLVGEIGGNDYNYPLFLGGNKSEVQSFVPLVVDVIALTIEELIKHGVSTIMVPGNLPIGCLVSYLTIFKSSDNKQYDPMTGCLIWLNEFAQYHNTLLQIKLNQIQKHHPHVNIFYADYYNAAMQIYRSPEKFGFTRGALKACCGGEGPYNYNSSVGCGASGSTCCTDPSLYANWDGLHLTEAAYKRLANGLLQGPYTIARLNINTLSLSTEARCNQSQDKSKDYINFMFAYFINCVVKLIRLFYSFIQS